MARKTFEFGVTWETMGVASCDPGSILSRAHTIWAVFPLREFARPRLKGERGMTATRLWYPHYVRDFRAKTRHLNCAEKGAYRELIDEYWERQGPLPADDDQLCRIAGAFPDEWRAIRENVIAFFKERDGKLYHSRIDDEIKKASEQHNAKVERIAKARAAKAAKNRPDNKPDDKPDDKPENKDTLHHHLSPSPSSYEEPRVSECDARARKVPEENVPRETFEADYAEPYEAAKRVIAEWEAFKGKACVATPGEIAGVYGAVQRHGEEKIMEVIARARGSPFLRGEEGNWSGMPLKWLWNDEKIAEISRGEHDGNGDRKTGGGKRPAGKVDDLREVRDWAKDFDRRERESVSGDVDEPPRRAIGSG